MSETSTSLIMPHGLIPSIAEALDDLELRPVERLMMWHLRKRLDLHEYREVYAVSIASSMRIEDQTAGRALRALVLAGYLDQHVKKRPRAYRFFWSRRTTLARPA